jgi:hypothetical protein
VPGLVPLAQIVAAARNQGHGAVAVLAAEHLVFYVVVQEYRIDSD